MEVQYTCTGTREEKNHTLRTRLVVCRHLEGEIQAAVGTLVHTCTQWTQNELEITMPRQSIGFAYDPDYLDGPVYAHYPLYYSGMTGMPYAVLHHLNVSRLRLLEYDGNLYQVCREEGEEGEEICVFDGKGEKQERSLRCTQLARILWDGAHDRLEAAIYEEVDEQLHMLLLTLPFTL